MTKTDSKQKNRWPLILGIIGTIISGLAIIVSIIQAKFPYQNPDFKLTVTPASGTMMPSEKLLASVEVVGINGYHQPVRLMADNLPSGLQVEWNPREGSPNPGFKSTLTVLTGPDVHEGDYSLEIRGTGNDGNVKNCVLALNIAVPKDRPGSAYAVFNDFGLPQGDIQVWSGADFGKNPPPLNEGNYPQKDSPEGTSCYVLTVGHGTGNYAGWGIFLGSFEKHKLLKSQTVDLKAYSSVQFWVKSGINLKVEIQEKDQTGFKAACMISQHGWKKDLGNTWQKITIPSGAFNNVDWTKIWSPFMITGYEADQTFMVDDVAWLP